MSEKEKIFAERKQFREHERYLSERYDSAAKIAGVSAVAGAFLYDNGMRIPAFAFLAIAVLATYVCICRYEEWRDYCDEHHV